MAEEKNECCKAAVSGCSSIGKMAIIIALIPFTVLTGAAVWQHGFTGIFLYELQNTAGMQVLVDLVIALTLVMIWMYKDAQRTQRTFWPWALITCAIGSFGPLFYLLFKKEEKK